MNRAMRDQAQVATRRSRAPHAGARALTRAILLLSVALSACGGTQTPTAGPGSVADQSARPTTSIQPLPSLAGSFEDLSFRLDLPESWVFGTADEVQAELDDLRSSDPEAASRMDALLAGSALLTSAFLAIEVKSTEAYPPRLSCNTVDRGSASPADALDDAERQNFEGVSQLPGIVGSPSHDRLTLPAGETVRVRWQNSSPTGVLGSIGYAFIAGPTMYTCVFTAAGDTVARHEPEWEAILGTFQADAAWSVTATIHVGIKPFQIAGGFGDVWVANADSGTISRVSPATNTVTATIDLRAGRPHPEDEGPFGIVASNDRVWVTSLVFDAAGNQLPGFLWAIDPATNRALASDKVGAGPMSAAVGFESIWIANFGERTVSRMDPATLKVVATIPVGAFPWAIAAGADAVWVANQADGTVSRIDPSTNLVVATVRVGGKLNALAVGQRGVWVSSDRAVSMIDPGTNAVTATVALDKVAGLVAHAGSIWGAENLGVNVHEIDEATASVRSVVALDTNSWGITVVGDSVWVAQPAAADKKFAERSPGTITRLDH